MKISIDDKKGIKIKILEFSFEGCEEVDLTNLKYYIEDNDQIKIINNSLKKYITLTGIELDDNILPPRTYIILDKNFNVLV